MSSPSTPEPKGVMVAPGRYGPSASQAGSGGRSLLVTAPSDPKGLPTLCILSSATL